MAVWSGSKQEQAKARPRPLGSGVSTISFSQIGGPWRIEILSSMDPRVSVNFVQDITVNGQFADRDYRNIGVNGSQFDARVDGQEAADWLIWDAVAANNETITLRFDSSNVNNGGNVVNAVRLVSVPEPSHPCLLLVSVPPPYSAAFGDVGTGRRSQERADSFRPSSTCKTVALALSQIAFARSSRHLSHNREIADSMCGGENGTGLQLLTLPGAGREKTNNLDLSRFASQGQGRRA